MFLLRARRPLEDGLESAAWDRVLRAGFATPAGLAAVVTGVLYDVAFFPFLVTAVPAAFCLVVFLFAILINGSRVQKKVQFQVHRLVR